MLFPQHFANLGKFDHINWLKVNHRLLSKKITLSEHRKQKLEAVLAFFRISRLLIFSTKFPWQIHVHSVFFLAFFDRPQNSKSLKYWANNEPGFISGLFDRTKILLKNLKNGQPVHNLKNGSDIYEHVQVSKAYTRRTNEKAVCLAVLFYLMYYPGILIFLMNVLMCTYVSLGRKVLFILLRGQ